jgi:hypothetical protein
MRRLFLAASYWQRSSPAQPSRRRAPTATTTRVLGFPSRRRTDIVGLELVGPSRDDPAAVVMTSLVATPRGQLQMNCALRADQATKALFAVRPIRDSIKPP